MHGVYPPHARTASSFHGSKRYLLGNQAGHVPPAWRTPAAPNGLSKPGVVPVGRTIPGGGSQAEGSKIFMSQLPMDVGEKEIEELFSKTVGPIKAAFVVYNSQGKSKGMAVVHFQRPGDAQISRQKYNGKIVDGRRPIKIEIISDTGLAVAPMPAPPNPPSLLNRISGVQLTRSAPQVSVTNGSPVIATPRPPRPKPIAGPATAQVRPPRVRHKKGPRRVKKSLAQLDKEMEDYRELRMGDINGTTS